LQVLSIKSIMHFQELLSPISKSSVKAEEMVHPLSHYWIASSHNT
jgi:hypothetical protein